MPSSDRARLLGLAALVGLVAPARAQIAPQGFALERFSPAPAGAGWLALDDLELHGGLGGALALTIGYARNPLRVTDGATRRAVVSDQAFADLGGAITCGRLRFSLHLQTPIVGSGESGAVGGYVFAAPSIDPGSYPDALSDARLGVDLRIVGAARSALRLGASGQLYVPFGVRSNYVTDGTFRGVARALVAGDRGRFTWAGHLGVHLRPLDDGPAPGSPRGSELLFGLGAGARLAIGQAGRWTAIVGPEIMGATALRSLFESNATALEALLGARLEGPLDGGEVTLRLKVGAGGGVSQHFGAPEARLVVGVELSRRGGP